MSDELILTGDFPPIDEEVKFNIDSQNNLIVSGVELCKTRVKVLKTFGKSKSKGGRTGGKTVLIVVVEAALSDIRSFLEKLKSPVLFLEQFFQITLDLQGIETISGCACRTPELELCDFCQLQQVASTFAKRFDLKIKTLRIDLRDYSVLWKHQPMRIDEDVPISKLLVDCSNSEFAVAGASAIADAVAARPQPIELIVFRTEEFSVYDIEMIKSDFHDIKVQIGFTATRLTAAKPTSLVDRKIHLGLNCSSSVSLSESMESCSKLQAIRGLAIDYSGPATDITKYLSDFQESLEYVDLLSDRVFVDISGFRKLEFASFVLCDENFDFFRYSIRKLRDSMVEHIHINITTLSTLNREKLKRIIERLQSKAAVDVTVKEGKHMALLEYPYIYRKWNRSY